MNRTRPSRIAVISGPSTQSKVPSGCWMYSPVKSPTVVSPSPATVITSGKAASTRLVLPVPGGPYSRAGTPAARSLRSASTSGMSASARAGRPARPGGSPGRARPAELARRGPLGAAAGAGAGAGAGLAGRVPGVMAAAAAAVAALAR